MTQEREFIKSACEEIHTLFPDTTLEYQYKEISDTHFIKVTPPEVYDTEKFLDLDIKLSDEFDTKFSGVLCFINHENLTELENSEIICSPKKEVLPFTYPEFFAVTGAVTRYEVDFGHYPVDFIPSQQASEDFSATGSTKYAMAA